MPDFTSSQKIPSASVLYAQCSSARNLVQTFHLLYKNSASSLSQLHLSIFTDPTQRARVYMTLESQNRGLWQTLPQSIQRLFFASEKCAKSGLILPDAPLSEHKG